MTWKYTHIVEYIDLVREFPLTVIKGRAQHNQAMAMLERLAAKETMEKAESDYFDVLSKLIKDYEDETVPAGQVTPQAVLSFVMEQRRLNHRDIARATGMQASHVSEFFAGKRNLPKHAAAKLAALFQVEAMIFLPKVEPATPKAWIVGQAQNATAASSGRPYSKEEELVRVQEPTAATYVTKARASARRKASATSKTKSRSGKRI